MSLLARETEGNLFFLVEVVRSLAEEAGQIEMVGTMTLPAKILTGGIGRFVQRRLNRVSPEQYALLQAAAVAGREIDPAVLRALRPGEDLDRFLADCANVAILDVADNRWRFSHDKLREGLLATLSVEERRALHSQIAQVTEQLYAGHPQYITVLAYHFFEGQNWQKAANYQIQAVDATLALYADTECRVYCANALESLSHLPDTAANRRFRVDTVIKQANVSWVADEPVKTLARLAEAETLLKASQSQPGIPEADRLRLARIHYWMGRTHGMRNENSQAIAHYRQVLTVAEELGDEELIAIPASAIGTVLVAKGELAKAEPFLSQARPLLEKARA